MRLQVTVFGQFPYFLHRVEKHDKLTYLSHFDKKNITFYLIWVVKVTTDHGSNEQSFGETKHALYSVF